MVKIDQARLTRHRGIVNKRAKLSRALRGDFLTLARSNAV